MKVYPLFLAVVCTLSLASCDKDKIREKDFTYWGEYEHDDQVRTDGMYVRLDEDSLVSDIIILYQNGLIYHSGCSREWLRTTLSEFCDMDDRRSQHQKWGAFIIEGMCFNYQSFQYRAGGQLSDLHVWKYEGILESDSSFTITKVTRHSGEVRDVNESYFFIPLENKPDSNCVLLEELGAP